MPARAQRAEWKLWAWTILGALGGLIVYWLSNTSCWQHFSRRTFTASSFYSQRVYVRVIELALATGLAGALVMLLVLFIKASLKEKDVPKAIISQSDYERQTMTATTAQLQNLRKTEAFRALEKKKGGDQACWNWQTRCRLKREQAALDNVPYVPSESEEDKGQSSVPPVDNLE